nr:hypothetical protein KPHV_66360 [Kitasatospora purpeofusca]
MTTSPRRGPRPSWCPPPGRAGFRSVGAPFGARGRVRRPVARSVPTRPCATVRGCAGPPAPRADARACTPVNPYARTPLYAWKGGAMDFVSSDDKDTAWSYV